MARNSSRAPGEEPAVDLGGRRAGDDVDLVSGVQHRHVRRVPEHVGEQLADLAEPPSLSVEVRRVQLTAERPGDAVEHAHHAGVSWIGQSCEASRDIAWHISATGLSTARSEPCWATPRAVSLIQAMPCSPTATG